MLPDTTDDACDTAREGGAQSPELSNMYRNSAGLLPLSADEDAPVVDFLIGS